jgi:hypothetical protein
MIPCLPLCLSGAIHLSQRCGNSSRVSSEVGLEASACVGMCRPSERTVGAICYGRILTVQASVKSTRGYGELHALIGKRGYAWLLQVRGLFADVAAHSTPRSIRCKRPSVLGRSGFSLVLFHWFYHLGAIQCKDPGSRSTAHHGCA